MNFKQQKEEILKRAKEFNACMSEYKKPMNLKAQRNYLW